MALAHRAASAAKAAARAAARSQRRCMSAISLAAYDKPDEEVVVRGARALSFKGEGAAGRARAPVSRGSRCGCRQRLTRRPPPPHTHPPLALPPQEFPRKARGLDYDLNWSLAGDKITTRGEAYRNAPLRDLLEFLPRAGALAAPLL